MVDLKILDTGWLSTDRTGTQQTTANRVNSGNAITLKAPSVTSRGKALLSKEPIPASFADAPVNVNGFENDTYSIELIIDKSTSSEYDLMYELNRLTKTKGVKLLYASYGGGSSSDTIKTSIELLGSTSTPFNGTEVGASTACIPGFVENVSVTDSATSSKFRVTLTFVVTG